MGIQGGQGHLECHPGREQGSGWILQWCPDQWTVQEWMARTSGVLHPHTSCSCQNYRDNGEGSSETSLSIIIINQDFRAPPPKKKKFFMGSLVLLGLYREVPLATTDLSSMSIYCRTPACSCLLLSRTAPAPPVPVALTRTCIKPLRSSTARYDSYTYVS